MSKQPINNLETAKAAIAQLSIDEKKSLYATLGDQIGWFPAFSICAEDALKEFNKRFPELPSQTEEDMFQLCDLASSRYESNEIENILEDIVNDRAEEVRAEMAAKKKAELKI
jgi:hypothetical protein